MCTLLDVAIEIAEDKNVDLCSTERRIRLYHAISQESSGEWPTETISDLREHLELKEDRITELEAIIKELDPDYWQKKALEIGRKAAQK